MVRPFLNSLGCPKALGANGLQGPKKENFQNFDVYDAFCVFFKPNDFKH